MSATYLPESTRTVTASAFRLDRIAGFAGLAFALIVGAVNVLVGSMAPPQFDASASEIAAYFTENRTALAAVSAAVPFAVVSLFLFLASSFPRLTTPSAEAAFWTRVGVVGLVLVEVMFLGRFLFELVLIANVESLAGEPALIETLWQLQSAAMTFNGLALAIALLGLSRAARLAGLIPAWQEALGLGAALAFFIATVAVVPSLEGSPIGLLGLPAFVAWLVWLALTSVRFLRTDEPTA
jgi:hypothetical protein